MGVCLGGLILIVLLALGLADPPRAGSLRWRVASPDEMPDSSLPPAFTLELQARSAGPAESAWGIRLDGAAEPLTILIDNEGYLSVSPDDLPHWAEFPHIHPPDDNLLYIHIDHNGAATLRINHEIAWQGAVSANSWEIIEWDSPQLAWDYIALYYE